MKTRLFKIKFESYQNTRPRKMTIEYSSIKENEQVIYEDAKEYVRANYGRSTILNMSEIKETEDSKIK